MAVFTWFPDASHNKTVDPSVVSARFGDGYEQSTPMGINTMPEKWSMTFTGSPEVIDPIEAFLRDRKGHEAFDWTTPEERTARFVCRRWQKQRERSAKVVITVEFEEVYGR